MAKASSSDSFSDLGLAARYQYRPLDQDRQEIRLLVVQAAADSPDGKIWCNMKLVSLHDQPVYETISYVWGDPSMRSHIIVDNATLFVPASSETVLRCMRYQDKPRALWIDAVCINQDPSNNNNNEEKGHQVALMADIYSNGFRNLVFLGRVDAEERDVKQSLQAVLRDARLETADDYDGFMFASKDAVTGRQRFSERGFDAAVDFVPLVRLYQSSWFGRLWIVQEASLSRDNMCYYECRESALEPIVDTHHRCNSPLALQDILKAARWLRYKQRHLPTDFRYSNGNKFIVASIIWQYADSDHGEYSPISIWRPDMSDMLQDLRPFAASEPLDHIFGIGGLLRRYDLARDLAEPDYGRTLAEVLRDVTRGVLEARKNLEHFRMLHHRLPQSEREAGIPSWAARWDVKWDVDLDYEHLYRGHNCHGGRDEIEYAPPSVDPYVLSVLGIGVGTVKERLITIGRDGEVVPKAMLDIIKRLSRLEIEKVSTSPDSQNALALSLIAASDHLEQPVDVDIATERYNAWVTFLTTRNELPPRIGNLQASGQAVDEARRRAADYQEAFVHACSKGVVFLTSAGRLGVGPKGLLEGDVVAMLFGCKWPVILRSLAAWSEYRVVGVCYVHGIMRGEAVEEHSGSGKVDEVFHLR